MELHVGTVINDRLRLNRHIATGGMGAVWEATDLTLDRRVAIKLLKSEFSADPEFLDRFRNEARTTARLNHQGIAAIYDYGEIRDPHGGQPLAFLVMEFVEGEPLNAVLSRMGRLPLRHSLDMLEQTARALDVAHKAGLVHRDVKPGNILITPSADVKITDFGIARAVDAAPVTQTGMVMGTAQYIAPEQARGDDAVAASDVYALGIVGYETITGRRPFDGDSAITVALKHINEEPPVLHEAPRNVRALIGYTLTKDPRRRYADGGEFAAAISAVRGGRMPPPPRGLGAAAQPAPVGAPVGPGRRPVPPPYPRRPPVTQRPPGPRAPIASRPVPRPPGQPVGVAGRRPVPPRATQKSSSGGQVVAWIATLVILIALVVIAVVVAQEFAKGAEAPAGVPGGGSPAAVAAVYSGSYATPDDAVVALSHEEER